VRKDFYIQWIDGVPCKLKEPFDFSFLGNFGKVFKVYDDQDSRNICKAPYVNEMGRMWGSTRFMSPEEFTLGAYIDEVTNVYAMGATAFALCCGHSPRPRPIRYT
jgi:serine/threonine-protein kinase